MKQNDQNIFKRYYAFKAEPAGSFTSILGDITEL